MGGVKFPERKLRSSVCGAVQQHVLSYMGTPLQGVRPDQAPRADPMNVFQNKYVSWNFKHLGSECGTVEFRRPPGVKDARSALYWVAFTLGFLEGAMGQDWSNVKEEKTHGTFLDPRIIIHGGLKRLGPTCAGIIDNMDDIREEKSQPTPATRQEKEVIAAKKREKT
ncbi:hypothetical protein MBR_04003, partial [Metarhizium brunneum ARSEF 3297]